MRVPGGIQETKHQKYVKDVMYCIFMPGRTEYLMKKLTQTLEVERDWMKKNKLRFNPKTELVCLQKNSQMSRKYCILFCSGWDGTHPAEDAISGGFLGFMIPFKQNPTYITQ